MSVEHAFTNRIKEILEKEFGTVSNLVFENNSLIQYLNEKTKSANRNSKSRNNFANLYALYVLIEDYVKQGFQQRTNYSQYEGVAFNKLLSRIRQLPFGDKLQNHALNHRLNEEFKKYFPTLNMNPVIRDLETGRYWINEELLKVSLTDKTFNLASIILAIIESYIETKRNNFELFLTTCKELQAIEYKDDEKIREFITSLLAPNTDARIFEIVSYAILKYHYKNISVYFGYSLENLNQEQLSLYKTGRTNANDGGIDFVMKPLGRFFQVTETLDVRKYFLDIEKIEKYPITFVIKSTKSIESLQKKLETDALKYYTAEAVVKKYIASIEEIINIGKLSEFLEELFKLNLVELLLQEIITQSKLEFNYEE